MKLSLLRVIFTLTRGRTCMLPANTERQTEQQLMIGGQGTIFQEVTLLDLLM